METIKRRFAVFGGEAYYPAGGLHDFVGSFDTLDEALAVAEATHQIHPDIERQDNDYEWWHIFDMKQSRIVGRSEFHGASDASPSLE